MMCCCLNVQFQGQRVNTFPFILVVNYLIPIKSCCTGCIGVNSTVTIGFEAIIKRYAPPSPPILPTAEFLQFFKIKYLLCLSLEFTYWRTRIISYFSCVMLTYVSFVSCRCVHFGLVFLYRTQKVRYWRNPFYVKWIFKAVRFNWCNETMLNLCVRMKA